VSSPLIAGIAWILAGLVLMVATILSTDISEEDIQENDYIFVALVVLWLVLLLGWTLYGVKTFFTTVFGHEEEVET